MDWQSGAIYGQFWIYPRVRLASYLSSVRFEIWKYLADTADEEGPLPQGEKVMGAAGAQYAGVLYTPSGTFVAVFCTSFVLVNVI